MLYIPNVLSLTLCCVVMESLVWWVIDIFLDFWDGLMTFTETVVLVLGDSPTNKNFMPKFQKYVLSV